MLFYTTNFIALVITCTALFLRQRSRASRVPYYMPGSFPDESADLDTLKDETRRFTRLYVLVYVLVMGADWLQGAHIYALYRGEMGFLDQTVARFFMAGFLSGSISAYFVGSLADRFGRRLLCHSYCILYALSCLSILTHSLPLLYLGRVLGGISTSILYSCFESWMVTEFHLRGLDRRESELRGGNGGLSRLFGLLTGVNSIVAITAGVVAEWAVGVAGTRVAPFMLSVGMLVCAGAVMAGTWSENYGVMDGEEVDGDGEDGWVAGGERRGVIGVMFSDSRILTLTLSTTALEASMYIFVFLWSPTLQLASPGPIPHGIIFANFMSFMLLGSQLFSLLTSTSPSPSPSPFLPPSITTSITTLLSSMRTTPERLLVVTFLTAALSLATAVVVKSEVGVFYAFGVFEVCVGIYFPAMGVVKGRVVGDEVRATVYGGMRVPLGVCVVAALGVVGRVEGGWLFVGCAGVLVLGGGAVGWGLVE